MRLCFNLQKRAQADLAATKTAEILDLGWAAGTTTRAFSIVVARGPSPHIAAPRDLSR
jgi:hypothetical protein